MSVAEDFLTPSVAPPGNAVCVAFVGDNQTHEMVVNAARQFYDDPLVRDGGSSEALQYLSEGAHPRVLIVDIGESSDPVSAILSLTTAFPEDVRLIGLGTVNDIALYRELIEAGVIDYLVKPVSEKALASALARVDQAPTETGGDGGHSTYSVAVLGSRGGCGATTMAVNLSWIIAEELMVPTVLLDLDLWFGTAALSLDLEPTRGLREALENPTRIDGLFLSSAIAKISEKLSVMATEEALTGDMMYNTSATEILIEALGHSYRCVVIDLPRSNFRMRHPVLQAANQIVLVTEMSLPGLRDSIRLLGAIEEAAPGTDLSIVANRTGGIQQAMPQNEFQKALGRKVNFQLPYDPKAFKDAANTGKAVPQAAPRSKAAKTLRDIAKSFGLELEDEAAKASKGLLRGLMRRG